MRGIVEGRCIAVVDRAEGSLRSVAFYMVLGKTNISPVAMNKNAQDVFAGVS